MSNTITIDASKARSDFFNILTKVYAENKGFLIKRAGVPVAELIRPRINKGSDIMKFFGAWKDVDTEAMIKYIYEGRKDKGETRRRLPSLK